MAYIDHEWQPLLAAATTGAGTPLACNTAKQITWEVVWEAGASAGQVVVESASVVDYAGTWAELGVHDFKDDGADAGTWPVPGGFVRARVSTDVVDGTVSVSAKRMFRG
jgi:hypothetical protein